MDPNDDKDEIEFDSGMGSLASSKDDSPDSKSEMENFNTAEPAGQIVRHEGDKGDYEEEPDETLGERIWGLTEMFPDRLRDATHSLATHSWEGVKVLYGLTRTVTWVVASSSVILFAPIVFEVERAQMDEMQRSQQKQVLFGPPPAAAHPNGNMAAMPPIQR